MTELFTNHGTGDTYMTLAFAHHKGWPVVYGNAAHAPIAEMFPHVPSRHGTFGEVALHVHPEAHPPMGISRYALLGRRVTHADLWRGLLDLPLDAEMKRGQRSHAAARIANRVVLIPEARSWPNSCPEFWPMLGMALQDRGWKVTMNSSSYSLAQLFDLCSDAEWVIGPQCGVMAILCHAMFPCRKTIATPSVDGHHYFKKTYPYAYVSTFAGEDYDDVEEVKINQLSQREAISDVLAGRHAQRLPVLNARVHPVTVELSPGDLLDRFSILKLKVNQLPPEKCAFVMREYLKYCEIASELINRSPTDKLFGELLGCNAEAWEHNEISVTGMLERGENISQHFADAARLNKERVGLRNLINQMCGSAFTEIKSYYEKGTK